MRALLLVAVLAPTGVGVSFTAAAAGGCPNSDNQFNAVYSGYTKLQSDLDGNGTTDAILVGRSNVFVCLRDKEGKYLPERIRALQFNSDAYEGYVPDVRDKEKDKKPDLVFEGDSHRYWFNGTGDGTFNPNRQEEPI